MMKMKKLSEDHYIIMDDSEIKEGDWIGFPNLKKFVPVQYFGGDLTGGEKKKSHTQHNQNLWVWVGCNQYCLFYYQK